MNPRAHPMPRLLAVWLLLAAAGLPPLAAAPAPQTARPEIPKSAFVCPTKPEEGRDPFFPNSLRPYQDNPDMPKVGPSFSDVVLKSILGTPPRVFAIINNHTFAPGDDGDIFTKDGQRVHIHCTNINPRAGTVTVEVSGTSVVLHLSGEP